MADDDEEGSDDVAEPEYEFVDLNPNRIYLAPDAASVEETFLTVSLRNLIPNINRGEFSWVTPRRHRVGAGLWRLNYNPVPPVVQQVRNLCIVYQVYQTLKFQMNVMAKFGQQVEVPRVSLPYLVRVFDSLPQIQKTFRVFLLTLHNEGFLSTQGYNARTQQTLPDARRYYIHWCEGFEREGLTDLEFVNRLKSSILYHGGVLAEVRMQSDVIDPAGEAHGPGVVVRVDDTDLFLGHALFVLGWRLKQWSFQFDLSHWSRPKYNSALQCYQTHSNDLS